MRDTRPDVAAVLDGLKPFQRDTVEHVFYRLYYDPEGSHRFLISDEVGREVIDNTRRKFR